MFHHQSSSTTKLHPLSSGLQVAAPYVSGVAYHWYAGDGWHELERLQDPNRVGSHQLVVVTVAVSQARVFFSTTPELQRLEKSDQHLSNWDVMQKELEIW